MAAAGIPTFDQFVKSRRPIPTFDEFVANSRPKDLGTGPLEPKPLPLSLVDAPPPPPKPAAPIFSEIPRGKPGPFDLPAEPVRNSPRFQPEGPIGRLPALTGPADFGPPGPVPPPPAPNQNVPPSVATPIQQPPPVSPLTPGPTTSEQTAMRRRDATGLGRPRLPENQPQAPPMAPPIFTEGAKFYADLPPVKAAIEAIPEAPRKVLKGAVKGGLEFAEGMALNPANAAIMTGTGGLGVLAPGVMAAAGQLVPRTISAYFTADMLHGLYEQYPEMRDAVESGDPERIANTFTKAAGTGAFAMLAAKHAVKGGEAQPAPIAPPEPFYVGDSRPNNVLRIEDAPRPGPAGESARVFEQNPLPIRPVDEPVSGPPIPPRTAEASAQVFEDYGRTPTERQPQAQPEPRLNRDQRRATVEVPEGKSEIIDPIWEGALRIADTQPSFGRNILSEQLKISRVDADILLQRMEEQGIVQRRRNANGRDVFHKPKAAPPAEITGTITSPEPPQEAAPTAEVQTVPETPETLDIQLGQLREGKRGVVMVPKGTELTPEMVPPGMRKATIKGVGRFYYDPKVTSEPNIYRAYKDNRLPEILGAKDGGMGAPDKSALKGPVETVVARSPEGTEVQSVVADQESIPNAVAQAEKVVPPGGQVEIVRPEEVIADREAAPKAEPIKPVATGKRATVYTPNETKLDTQYEIVDASQLRTSFDPGYRAELQPRDTSRIGSRERIDEIKSRLNPARLGASVNAGDGALIILDDGSIVVGNHRGKAIQEMAAEQGKNWSAYQEWLAHNAREFGISPENLKATRNPVLVRRMLETPVDLQRFAEEANMPTTAKMSDAENAVMLARRISPEALAMFDPSGKGVPNPEFVRAVIADLPASERSILMDKSGQMNQAGLRTIRSAVFAKAYENTDAIERMTESLDDNVRNFTAGLLDAAPDVIRMREGIAGGDLYDRNIGDEIARAAEVISDLRDSGTPVDQWLRQENMFGRDQVVDALVESLDEFKRSSKQITQFIRQYTKEVREYGSPKQPDMFGNSQEPPSKVEILNGTRQAVRDAISAEKEAGKSKREAYQSGELFAEQPSGSGSPSESPRAPEDSAGAIESESASVKDEPKAKLEVSEKRRKTQRGSFSGKNVTSPSYDETKSNFLDRFGDTPKERAALKQQMDKWEALNKGRRTVTFEEIREQAKAIDPRLLRDLKPVREGETLNPAVRVAAESRLNALNEEIIKRTEKLAGEGFVASAEAKAEQQAVIDSLERQARELMDVLFPARSQDGRNLAYHRIVAEKTFDVAYWVSKAQRLANGELPAETETTLRKALAEGAQAEREGKKAKADHARAEIAQVMMRVEKSSWLEIISAIRRAGLLTGIKTHARNIGGNASFALLEEASRVPASMIDIAASLFTGKRTVQGASPISVAKATYEAATRGMREAHEILKKGQTAEELAKLETHKELNSGSKVVDAYVNGVFRLMGAEDRVFRVYAFERSLQEQMRLAKVAVPTEAMRAQAIADAEFATFNNKNVVSTSFSGWKGVARQQGPAGKALAFASEMVVPFARTPANIIARVIDYAGGGVLRAGWKAGEAIAKKSFTAEQQRAIARNMGRGLTGPALVYLGYMLAEKGLMTGTSEQDPGARNVSEEAGRLNGAILVNGKWRQVGSFSPAGNLMVIGATLQRESTRPLKNEMDRASNIAGIALETVGEQPMLQGMQDVTTALNEPGKRAERLVSGMAGSFVPTAVSDAASVGDSVRRDADGDTTLEAIKNAVKGRIPKLRNTLPARQSVLGRELPQAKVAAVDPTITSEARELTDEVSRELVQRGVKIGKVAARQGETGQEKALRTKATGKLINAYIRELVSSNEYRDLPTTKGDDSRKDAIEDVVAKARREINRIVNHDEYKAMGPKERIEILREVIQEQGDK